VRDDGIAGSGQGARGGVSPGRGLDSSAGSADATAGPRIVDENVRRLHWLDSVWHGAARQKEGARWRIGALVVKDNLHVARRGWARAAGVMRSSSRSLRRCVSVAVQRDGGGRIAGIGCQGAALRAVLGRGDVGGTAASRATRGKRARWKHGRAIGRPPDIRCPLAATLQRAESREQRAESREQRAERNWHPMR
jgi:hypothetical protein